MYVQVRLHLRTTQSELITIKQFYEIIGHLCPTTGMASTYPIINIRVLSDLTFLFLNAFCSCSSLVLNILIIIFPS